MDEINWVSMILATITPIIIGSVYYNKALVGKVWTNSNSLDHKKVKQSRKIVAFGLSILLSFLLSFFLLNFNNSGINQEGDFDTFLHGVWHGTFIAVTVAAPVVVVNGF